MHVSKKLPSVTTVMLLGVTVGVSSAQEVAAAPHVAVWLLEERFNF